MKWRHLDFGDGFIHCMAMSKKTERKPLRQRVAERKAGIKEEKPLVDLSPRLRHWAKMGGHSLQALGICILLYVVTVFTNSGFNDRMETWVMVSIVTFLVGRVLLFLVKHSR